MSVKSKLRKPHDEETRYVDKNGNRKLYDRDKAPDGTDFDVWHLALLFEQKAHEDRAPVAGRPILYTELNYRINESGIRRDQPDDWIDIVERMIALFWWETTDRFNTINDFCSPAYFDKQLEVILEVIDFEELLKKGIRVKQQEREVQPARRTDEETEAVKIITKRYTETDLKSKLDEFKSRSNN